MSSLCEQHEMYTGDMHLQTYMRELIGFEH